MTFYVQYNPDGTISGTVLSTGDAPQPPEPIKQLMFDEWQDTTNKRVNLDTLTLEDVPSE